MVLIVILLHFLEMSNEGLTVVNINMGHIIAHISNKESNPDHSSQITMENAGNGREEERIDNSTKSRRENEAIRVHGDHMVNTMDDKVKPKSPFVIGKRVIKVEKTSMEAIFRKSPDK